MANSCSGRTDDFCVYCGSTEDLDIDHVPPQNIFPRPRPSSLITVPSCKRCNGGASKDDEHFRMMLCLSQEVGDSPEAQKNWPAIFRSLQRPQALGMAKALFGSIRPVQAVTWGGIHLGTRIGFKVDLDRINRVIERTVRGLYFRERNQRLPEGFDVKVICDEILIRMSVPLQEQWKAKIIHPLAAVEPKIVVPGVFFYRFLVAYDDPAGTIWSLTFYERKSFLVLTGPAIPRPQPAVS